MNGSATKCVDDRGVGFGADFDADHGGIDREGGGEVETIVLRVRGGRSAREIVGRDLRSRGDFLLGLS